MNVEVINTGTELLLGNTFNSHLVFLARELFPIGLRIGRQVTVPDGPAIRDAIAEALGRAEVIFVTGGLGPTTDDVTREITAELLGLELEHDPEVMTAIEVRFAQRGFPISDRVNRQAQVPRGATVIPNENGSAPGLHLKVRQEEREVHLFLLPGPPRELQPMVTELVLPILKGLQPGREVPECRTYRVAGLGESQVEALVGRALLEIDGIELGYCARSGEVDVRVIGTKPVLEKADAIITEKLGENIASRDNLPLEEVVVSRLTEQGRTVAVAESCTGGFLSNRLTNVPGASRVFIEGFVTYANEAKTRALGIPAELILAHGAVSAEVASAMAENAVRISGADYALATTGIAGPGGGTPEKPTGTVYIALAFQEGKTIVQKHDFPTDRENFKWLVAQTALDLLRRNFPGRGAPG